MYKRNGEKDQPDPFFAQKGRFTRPKRLSHPISPLFLKNHPISPPETDIFTPKGCTATYIIYSII